MPRWQKGHKLRVVTSQVAKHHIFATLQEQAGSLPLPFEPNQSYYSHVKTMIVNGNVSNPKPSYDASLQSSRNAVLMLVFKERVPTLRWKAL